MSNPSQKPPSRFRAWLRVAATVVAAALLIAFLLRREHAESVNYLRTLEKVAAKAESDAVREMTGTLAALDATDASRQIRATLSARLLQELGRHLGGMEFAITDPTVGPIAVRIERFELDLRDGCPRVVLAGNAEARKQKVRVAGRAILAHTLAHNGIQLRVHCLGLAPQAEGVTLPAWAATIADAVATKAANEILAKLPLRVPIASQLSINFDQPAAIEQWVKTNNGRVLIRVTLPTVQPIVRHVQPRAVFFSKAGLHLAADLLPRVPETPVPIEAGQAQRVDWPARLESWRITEGRDLWARAGSGAVLDIFTAANQWPEANRALRFQGVREEGHLMDKTGGAPFGNGFGAWLEGPERLQGNMLLQSITPVWQADKQRLLLAARVAADGSVQVHFHGNAPRIPPPKVFGLKLGGGVKIGGGAGSSIGARVPRQVHSITGAVQWIAAARAFEVRVVEPGELGFKLDIGGVPDELESLFRSGFRIPLPRDQPLYRFKMPALIEETLLIPVPHVAGGGKRVLRIVAADAMATFTPDGLELSSRLSVE